MEEVEGEGAEEGRRPSFTQTSQVNFTSKLSEKVLHYKLMDVVNAFLPAWLLCFSFTDLKSPTLKDFAA